MVGLSACRPKHRTGTLCPGLVVWRVSCRHDVAHSASGLGGGYHGPVCCGKGPQVETGRCSTSEDGRGGWAERVARAAHGCSPSLPSLLVAACSGTRAYVGVVGGRRGREPQFRAVVPCLQSGAGDAYAVVAVAPYSDAVGGLAVPDPYPVDGRSGCLAFSPIGVAR